MVILLQQPHHKEIMEGLVFLLEALAQADPAVVVELLL